MELCIGDEYKFSFSASYERKTRVFILPIHPIIIAQVTNGDGDLALHWAVRQNPVEVFRALLDAYPQGAQVTDRDGDLALHMAAATQAPVEVVRALLDAHPQGVQATNNGGRLPLHEAAENLAPVEVVRALLDAYPQGAQVMDNDGHLAMHLVAVLPAHHDEYCPNNHAMLALAHAGFPPSRPWTPATCAALLRIAADAAEWPELRELVDAHLSRVRTLLLVSHRRGLHSELLPLLVGPVYAHDFFAADGSQ